MLWKREEQLEAERFEWRECEEGKKKEREDDTPIEKMKKLGDASHVC